MKLGRPRTTTTEMDNFIVETSDNFRKMLPREINKLVFEKFGVKLSVSGTRRRLRQAGLFGRTCIRKPLLKPLNKVKRLVWAFKHRNWTAEQWQKVLWSDEKKFELFNSKRRTYCRRRKGEALREDTVQGTVKHGGGSAMFWGCFGGTEVGDIHPIEGIMDSRKYHSILMHHAIPSGQRIFGEDKFVFQEDNDPKHTSKMCKAYMQQKVEDRKLDVMIWPPQSPDLSPIELLWDEVDRQVQAQKPTSESQLMEVVKETWKNSIPLFSRNC